jgi:hypothetical protein
MVDRDPSLPTRFIIYQELDTGIYECGPIGVLRLEDNYPIWVIASLDLKDLKLEKDDLVNVSNFRSIIGKDKHYIATATAKANNKPITIIAIPQIEFRKYFGDEDGDFGIDVPRITSTSENDREDVVRNVNTTHLKTPDARERRNINELPPIIRHQTCLNILSPGHPRLKLFSSSSSYKDSPIREKLKEIIDDIPPTIPHFKKSKKSSRKSLNKSKTSIKCKKTPYAWKSSSIKKSPFRTLKEAKDAETKYKAGQPIGFTAISSLKSQGRIPRSDGCYVLGDKYSALKRR